MYKSKKTGRIVGALFLIAMVASLLGAGFIETILDAPDYLSELTANETSMRIGVLLEFINGVAVVGIAVMMFPLLRKYDEVLALGYVALRVVEAVIVVAALISPLALISLSREYAAVSPADAPSFQAVGASLTAVRGYLIGQMLGLVFSLAAFLLYYAMHQLVLVPRFITLWGLIAVVLVFTWNLLEFLGFSISVGIVFGLPIILNEIFLGIWLIAKGFNPPVVASSQAGAEVVELAH